MCAAVCGAERAAISIPVTSPIAAPYSAALGVGVADVGAEGVHVLRVDQHHRRRAPRRR